MRRYNCTFKMPGDVTPMSCSYEAEHPGTAIVKFMAIAKVQNTTEVEEVEILEAVRDENGKHCGYKSVFIKLKSDQKGRVISSGSRAMVPATAPAAPAKKEEATPKYSRPYTVEVL